MKRYYHILLFLFTSNLAISQKIAIVNNPSDADIKVIVVNQPSQADLKVYVGEFKRKVEENGGIWFFTSIRSAADKKILFVNVLSRADLKIYFVSFRNQAGWINEEKKMLFEKLD